jgi:1,2-diacylglycerol 3-beta-galactosyltransferase
MDTETRRKVTLIYVDSGGGHRAAATALRQVIEEQGWPWDIQMESIQDLLDSIDIIQKTTGIPFQDIYNIMLRRGWTLGSAQLIPVMHALIRLFHGREVRVLTEHWSRTRPDLVVSLIPHYNRAVRQALASTCPATPYVTLLTDICDYPPHFWIEDIDQYVICGSERASAQAAEIGIPRSRILPVSGMILSPKFYASVPCDRAAERIRLGLRPDLPTGLVLFGGEGSMKLVEIARALNRPGAAVQLILICGRHTEAMEELRHFPPHIPMFVEGFTREIPFYMELADFFIGKPGPGSISEALSKRLPVIVERNAWTMVHERCNADWIEEQQLGIVVRNFSEIGQAVERLLAPESYQRYRSRAARISNRAVYEIPYLLEKVLLESNGQHSLPVAGANRLRNTDQTAQ